VTATSSDGIRVLRNAHVTIARGAARLLIGGVIDFAARMSDPDARPRPDLATTARGAGLPSASAHNPKIAPLAGRPASTCNCRTHARRPVLPGTS